jgi:hypothetical protein
VNLATGAHNQELVGTLDQDARQIRSGTWPRVVGARVGVTNPIAT